MNMKVEEKEKWLKAGSIASEVIAYAKTIIKRDMKLLDIAEKIEDKIRELGGEPAFPTGLSIDSIAAHYTPYPNDETLAHGLLKVDLGAHVDGYISDTSFSIDLDNNKENIKLIEAADFALENASKIVKAGITTGEIGAEVLRSLISLGCNPIVNLSGHQIDRYDLHSGLTIPNYADSSKNKLVDGIYAIEPFCTIGEGKVHDGKPSSIYLLTDNKNVRSPIAREVLTYITEEYGSLPFCSRWIVKEFGSKALVGLNQLESNGNLYHFSNLVESSGANVAQAEHTFLVEGDKSIITTA